MRMQFEGIRQCACVKRANVSLRMRTTVCLLALFACVLVLICLSLPYLAIRLPSRLSVCLSVPLIFLSVCRFFVQYIFVLNCN